MSFNTYTSLESLMAGPLGDAVEQGKHITILVASSREVEFAPLIPHFARHNIDVTFTPYMAATKIGFFVDEPLGVLS
jgi:hypothetical protein